MTGRRFLLALGSVAVLAGGSLQAYTLTVDTWTGGTSTDFEIAGNWSGGVPINQNDVNNYNCTMATFNTPTANQPSTTLASRKLAGINFTQAGWAIGGTGALDFGDTRVSPYTIRSAGAGVNTIAPPIGNNYVTISLGVGNTLDLKATTGHMTAIDYSGKGVLRLGDGMAAGSFSIASPIRFQSTGQTVELGSGYSQGGPGWTVNGNTVRQLATMSSTLGDPGGSSMTISGGGVWDSNGYDFTWGGNGSTTGLFFGTGGGTVKTGSGTLHLIYWPVIKTTATNVTSVLSGKVSMDEPTKTNLVIVTTAAGTTPSGIDLDWSAVLTGTNASSRLLTKNGTGTLRLSGANLYGGGTTVTQGRLLVANASGSSATGTGAVTVSSGATLGGTGSISPGANKLTLSAGTGTAQANWGGIVSPGASIGTLTVNDNVDFQNYATYVADLNGTLLTSDLMAVTGDLKLGTNATVKLGSWIGDPTGDAYTLFTYGTLSGVAPGVLPWTIDTSGTGWTGGTVTAGGGVVTLTGLVPEPATALFLGLGAAAGLLARRRR